MSLLIQGSFSYHHHHHTHKNTSAFQPPPAAFPAHALHARGSHVTAHTRISFIPSPPHTHKETPAHLNSHLLRFLHTRSMRGGEPCQCSYKDPIHTITTTHTKNTSPFELPPAAFPAGTPWGRPLCSEGVLLLPCMFGAAFCARPLGVLRVKLCVGPSAERC